MNLSLSRRQFGLSVGSTFVLGLTDLSKLAAAAPMSLTLALGKNSPTLRDIEASIQVNGDLKLNPDGKEIRRMPLDVAAQVHYQERAFSDTVPRALRYYQSANTKFAVGKTSFTSELRDHHRLIGAGATAEDWDLFSVQGPLNRDELEMLNSTCNTIVLDEMLPGSAKAVEDSWEIAATTLAKLLHLDVVHESNVKGTLKAIESEMAIIYFEGTLQASTAGVSTEIELKAKANFDREHEFVSWFNLAYKENRSIGHAEPGYEAILKMKIKVRPVADSESHLTDKLLAASRWREAPITLLEFTAAKSPFQLQIGRQWRVVNDDDQSTILRLVDRGDLIAQGDISLMVDLPPGKSLPLEEFQQEVENALGESFGQFVEASQSVTDRGISMLRVAAIGMTKDLPIQWNYYHLSDPQGRQAAMVFTCESELIERLQDQDRAIAQSFQFVHSSALEESKQPAKDQPSKIQAESSPKDANASRPSPRSQR